MGGDDFTAEQALFLAGQTCVDNAARKFMFGENARRLNRACHARSIIIRAGTIICAV